MLNRKIEVFGRIKPASSNSQTKDFTVEESINDDVIRFNSSKYSSIKRTFRFKKIFLPGASTQTDVFENAAKPIIENVLTGYNGTIFAYGQTGTGKTYTMTGDFSLYSERGIIPRTIQFLFHSLTDNSTVSISYFEIYNEHGYDLIGYQPTTNTVELQQISVLEDSKGNLHFRNLSAHYVKSVQEALDLLLFGDGNRMVAETMNNLRSSRSHAIFLVTLETADPDSEQFRRSTLHLVDLAGSERLGKTINSSSSNTLESRYINLSLHYLEQVLVALGEPGRIHIPYRNSLMTTVLKNSLGGNCCTAMIATFSTEPKDFEETLQTCRFSQRVALVRNDPTININQILNTNKELDQLRKENAYLREQIALLKSTKMSSGVQQPVESDAELLDTDKDECMEKVKGFIADSQFVNLPLTDSTKAKYCFVLMRNEILRLRPESKMNETSEEFKTLNSGSGTNSTTTAMNYRKVDSNIQFKATNDGNIRRKAETILRKRRVVMDIPKINVIYKKYKSTESVSRELLSSSKCDANGQKQQSSHYLENKSTASKISQFSQTSSTLLKLPDQKDAKNQSSLETFPPEMDDKEKENMVGDKKFDSSQNKADLLSYSRVHIYEDVRFSLVDVPGRVELAHDEEDDDDYDGGDDDDEDVEKTLRVTESEPIDSNRSSQFSASGLPLTGDMEIDEEIIKFYRARYHKFKSKD